MPTLRISEIFFSIQGETSTAGLPTVFVRLTGCPLRCTYCDTAYAFSGGRQLELDEILDEVERYGIKRATVTGGEPLAQTNCHQLLGALCDRGYAVSLETSGALPIARVDERVTTVMDLKTPSSGESGRNDYSNIEALKPNDEIKFVISDRADYEWVKSVITQRGLAQRAQLLLSPNHERLHPRVLGEWMLSDRLPTRLQVQLHKYLWGDVPGR